MLLNKDDALSLVIAILVFIVFILTVFGIVANPKIGYGLSTNISVNDTIKNDEYIRINVTINNSGYLFCSAKITVRYYNLTSLNDDYTFIEKSSYNELTIPFDFDSGDLKEEQVELTFLPKENASNLVLYAYATKNYSDDLIQNYGTSFCVITLRGKNVVFLTRDGEVYRKGDQVGFQELIKTYPNLLK